MIRTVLPASLFATAILLATSVAAAPYLKGARLRPQAKIPLAAARLTALRARPGRIVDQEIEREKGGSGLRYSFDIAAGGKTYEVGVDARTGTVLEVAAEGPHPD